MLNVTINTEISTLDNTLSLSLSLSLNLPRRFFGKPCTTSCVLYTELSLSRPFFDNNRGTCIPTRKNIYK